MICIGEELYNPLGIRGMAAGGHFGLPGCHAQSVSWDQRVEGNGWSPVFLDVFFKEKSEQKK